MCIGELQENGGARRVLRLGAWFVVCEQALNEHCCVFCSPFDKEVSVRIEADMDKWSWTFHPQADGSYVIQNVKFGGTLFCSHKTFKTNGVWCYAVDWSPYDKAGNAGEIAGKCRWHIADTMNGITPKHFFCVLLLYRMTWCARFVEGALKSISANTADA